MDGHFLPHPEQRQYREAVFVGVGGVEMAKRENSVSMKKKSLVRS